ncbi:hypothetical protein C8R45DRAFT_923001 [Mycena sanguinolenta]|nr:hypothetical protein C8R45DRAFT_923001 [Mycena sanguinolenta]
MLKRFIVQVADYLVWPGRHSQIIAQPPVVMSNRYFHRLHFQHIEVEKKPRAVKYNGIIHWSCGVFDREENIQSHGTDGIESVTPARIYFPSHVQCEPSSLVFYPPAFQSRRRCLTPEDPPINACHRCTKKGLHCEYIPIAMQRDQSATHENGPTIPSSPVSLPPLSPASIEYFSDEHNQPTFPATSQFHPYLDPVRDFAPRRRSCDDAGEYSRKSQWEIVSLGLLPVEVATGITSFPSITLGSRRDDSVDPDTDLRMINS